MKELFNDWKIHLLALILTLRRRIYRNTKL